MACVPGDPSYASVSLLCHGDGTNGSTAFVDNSPFARSTAGGTMIARPNTTVSTTTPKFGTGSVDFGANALFYMAADATVPFEFGANPFTVEAWGWLPSAPTATHVIACCYASVFNNSWMFCFDNSGANLKFVYSSDGTTFPSVSAAYAPATSTWIHFAADRDVSNVLRIYANGAVLASATVAATFFNAATRPCSVGGDSGFTKNWPGRLDDIRITKGVARYGGAFTPPTAAFPNVLGPARCASGSFHSPFSERIQFPSPLLVGALALGGVLARNPVTTRRRLLGG